MLLASILSFALSPNLLPMKVALGGFAPISCEYLKPKDLDDGPSSWLGRCKNGEAEGLGVIRVKTPAGFDYFAGRMLRGKPFIGMIDHGRDRARATGYMFDNAGNILRPNDITDEVEINLNRQSVEAYRSVARRFAAQGNAASARFYMKLAVKRAYDWQPGE